MASFSFTSRFFNLTLLIFIFMASMGFCFQFEVGGDKGWVTPTGNDTDTYNRWASSLRFNIGDTLLFKYQDDTVLEVSNVDYKACNTANPLGNYEDGSTVFQLDRSGHFYFISGDEDHCKSGQKLIIQVIHPTEDMRSSPQLPPSPSPSPSPSPGPSSDTGGDDASDSASSPVAHSPVPASSPLAHHRHSAGSSIKFNVSSFFTTTFGVMIVFLYRFV